MSQVLTIIFGKMFGAIASVMLIRYLGAEKQGVYAYLLTIVSLFSFISDFGLQSLLVREVKSAGDKGPAVLGNALFLQVIQVLISIVIINIYGAFFEPSPEIKKSLMLASLAGSILYIVNPFLAAISSHEKIYLTGISNGLASLFNAVLIFISVTLKFPLNGIIIMLGFSNILYLLLAGFLCLRYTIKPSFEIKKDTLVSLFKMSIPFAMIGLFNFIYSRIDVPLLYKMRPGIEVGYYTAVTKIIEILNALVMMLMSPVYPRLSSIISTEGRDKAPRIISLTVKYMMFVVAPFAMMVSVSAANYTNILLGHEFVKSVPALSIMIWNIFLMAIYVIPTFALNSARQAKLVMYLYCFNIFINLGFNIVLIPKYGYIATSFISVLCSLIIAAGVLYFAKVKVGNFIFFPNILRLAASMTAQLLFMKFFEKILPFVPLNLLSLMVFCASALAFRYFTREDVTIAAGLFKKNNLPKSGTVL